MNPIHSTAAAAATLTILAMLAACGGGGGGSPTLSGMPGDPPTMTPDPAPAVPTVASTVTVTNGAAIDPTLAFRALQAQPPAADGFEVTVTAPATPVIVFDRHDGPRADLAPDDLDAMMRRAAHLWTRRLTDGGTWPVRLHVGHPQAEQCPGATTACAGTAGDSSYHPDADVALPDGFLTRGGMEISGQYMNVLVHEVGHALGYRDIHTGHTHADCVTNLEQVMCGRHNANRPLAPTEADFAGLADGERGVSWTVTPAAAATDHQDFGTWAAVPGSSGLDRFGVSVRRTLSVDESVSHHRPAAEALADTITIEAEVRGSPSAGPAAGLGTATWTGIFLGADTGRFEPVTGDATLTADLADLAAIDLALSALERTDGTRRDAPARRHCLRARAARRCLDRRRRAG